MAIKTTFPAAGTPRPSGLIINPSTGDKLRFTLRTTSPAPIFSFSVDAVPQWEQGNAKVRTTSTTNTYTWDHPTTGVFGHNQLQDLFLKVLILTAETYDYTIQKIDSAGASTDILKETMSGAGIERSDFMLGLL